MEFIVNNAVLLLISTAELVNKTQNENWPTDYLKEMSVLSKNRRAMDVFCPFISNEEILKALPLKKAWSTYLELPSRC